MYRMKPCGRLESRSAAQIEKSRLGIGFEKLDRDAFDPEKAYDKLGAIGVKWVRIQSGWQKTEKQKGVYDFEWLDRIVDNIIARGMTPWMCVCYGNALYGGMAEEVFGAVGCPPIHTDEQREAWHAYCRALAAHFRGRVDHMEIWNEPDGQWCWKHGVSATELGQFTIATAKALKEGNPDCYIIGGALCHVDVLYLNEAFKTGMADWLDAISFHAYIFSDRMLKHNIAALRAVIRQYKPSLEIIQGESGCQSRPNGNGALKVGGWTPKKQCKHLLRHLVTDLGMDVKFTSYFSCMDMMEALHGRVGDAASYKDFGYFGVLGAEFDEDGKATGDYLPKPSYYALSSLASLLAGDLRTDLLPIQFIDENAPHCGNIPTIRATEAEFFSFRLDDGAAAFAYWYPSNVMTEDYEGAISLRCSDLGDVRLVDPMDGTVYEIPENLIEKDAFGGMHLHLLPIRDYPLFLVFGGHV